MTELYLPSGCTSLADQPHEQQIRLGLQAPPFGGKTTAAMTFPNPVVLDFNQKLGAFQDRPDIISVPFWNGAFVDKITKRNGLQSPPNRRDALLIWLNGEGVKLSKEQTLIVDSSTEVELAFHQQYRLAPVYTAKGAEDGFAEWRQKEIFFDELCGYLKALKCHVIYIVHELPERNDKGNLTGKVDVLLTGKSGVKIAGNFTDWFRVLPFAKPDSSNKEQYQKFKDFFRLDDAAALEWMKSGSESSIFVFQTQPDELAKCGTSSLVGAPKYILADYKSFAKYKRNNTTK